MYQTLIKPLASDVKKFFLDTVFPIRCLVCDIEGQFICGKCISNLHKLDKQYCIVCAKPSVLGFTHPGCASPHTADGLISILNYHDEKVSDILIKGKYSPGFLFGVYEVLGKFLAKKLKQDFHHLLSSDVYLVPIPLSKTRQRWRGFNQAELLCQAISAELNLSMTNVLIKQKSTKTQKDLKREQRIENVKSAFSVSPPFQGGVAAEGGQGGWSGLRDKNFLLTDDVTTTGSTLLEAAKVLKRNGAKNVWCLTVARD